MGFWQARRVVVTGGSGFLGSYLVPRLRAAGCREIFTPRRRDYDLVDGGAVRRLFADTSPHLVIHLAARVGGIGANQANPGRFFYENLMMGAQLMEEARRRGVEKFVSVGTVCAYPKLTPVPFRETDLWNGYPEETNAAYGLAKKMLFVQGQAYRQEFGFNAIGLIPTNLYGPHDNFDLTTSHVIPALIRKCVEARRRGDAHVEVWGDGSPSREFLYADDAAEAILLATERYDSEEPVNLGSGVEISIWDLAHLIARLTGFQGTFTWDTRRPNGQPRRSLDVSRAERLFGFRARTSFEEGLRRTVAWYEQLGQTLREGPAT
jgi:GDP-L-fucose synthase